MLGVSSPHMTHHSASQADLDVLAILTGEHANSLGPLPPKTGAGSNGGAGASGIGQDVRMKKTQVPRRDGPMESLMLSAVIAGAGNVSRHHFGHGAGESFVSKTCGRVISEQAWCEASR
jgi:GTP cyclohydrolase II